MPPVCSAKDGFRTLSEAASLLQGNKSRVDIEVMSDPENDFRIPQVHSSTSSPSQVGWRAGAESMQDPNQVISSQQANSALGGIGRSHQMN